MTNRVCFQRHPDFTQHSTAQPASEWCGGTVSDGSNMLNHEHFFHHCMIKFSKPNFVKIIMGCFCLSSSLNSSCFVSNNSALTFTARLLF